MTKAEQFIEDHTSNQANISIEISNGGKIQSCSIPWLTPDQARKAVEIAREETYDKIWHWLAEHINDYVVEGKGRDIDLMFDDLKQAMRDE